MIDLLKRLIYIIINLPNLIVVSRLFSDQKYDEIIKISKNKLDKKSDDLIAKRNIAIAYVYTGKADEGFEYIKGLINDMKSNSAIERMLQYFIYPEFKNKNYDKIIYRCSYFNDDKMSQESKNKINKIVSEARNANIVNTKQSEKQ